jgi:DtxR family transcriptional regulator, manganese transport regulator
MVVTSQPRRDLSRLEDYLEAIYSLNEAKGFISAADISDRLGVKPPTVSSMVARLAKEGYLVHEPYRGMKLTPAGERVARSVIKRHRVIAEFLSMVGVDDETAYEDTEGIEHHVQPTTLERLEKLAEYLRKNPTTLRAIRKFIGS